MAYEACCPEAYEGKKVGDGTDVAFVRLVANAPPAGVWKPGVNVMKSSPERLKKGTVIATFTGDHFEPNDDEVSIYLSHDARGLRVMDQWQGHVVHVRTIPSQGPEDDRAEDYCVVE